MSTDFWKATAAWAARLTSEVQEDELEQLNLEFSDLLNGGTIELHPGPQSEQFDRHLKPLPHLRFKFRWGRNGRLRQMINRINDRDVPAQPLPPERGEGGRLPVETDP
jgi:hypothetical protein